MSQPDVNEALAAYEATGVLPPLDNLERYDVWRAWFLYHQKAWIEIAVAEAAHHAKEMTEWQQATNGTKGSCKRCHKSITLRGDKWLDLDGTTRCIQGHVHSVSGDSAMPGRLNVPIAKEDKS